MNRIGRRRSASKGKPNPFENRGLDKFQEVYSELERMRSNIAAEEGVSTSDVWFTRGNGDGGEWIPIVVGRSRSSSASSRLQKKESDSIPHWEDAEVQASPSPERTLETTISLDSSQGGSQSSCWFSLKFDQFLHELQQLARKALKAISLFLMIAAAVADVLVAVVAGFASSLIAKYLRPLWAQYLPARFPQQQSNRDTSFAFPAVALGSINTSTPALSCGSAPSSPGHESGNESPPLPQVVAKRSSGSDSLNFVASLRGSPKPRSSSSTPVSPVRGHCTYFSSDRPGFSSSPTNRIERAQRFEKLQKHQHQHQHHQQGELDHSSCKEARGVTQLVFMVLVILIGLSFGGLSATMMASVGWFVFPVVEGLRGKKL